MSILGRIVLMLTLLLVGGVRADAGLHSGGTGIPAGVAGHSPAFVADAAAPPIAPAPTPPPAPPAAPTTQAVGELSPVLSVVVGVVLLAVAMLIAWAAGCFRGGGISAGPHRLAPGSRVLPLLLIMLLGGGVWIGAQTVFYFIRAYQYARDNGGAHLTIENLSAMDVAYLATLPACFALVVVLTGDAFAGLLRRIGLPLTFLPRGLVVGIGYGLLALLVVQGASMLLAAVYELVGYEHPAEHELLAAMKEAPYAAKLMLVVGACVMAPLFEELLFRGHLQTLLTRLFTPKPVAVGMLPPPVAFVADPYAPIADSVLAPPPLPVAPTLGSSLRDDLDSQSPAPFPLPYETQPSSGMRWVAVIITSVIFAVVHPLWMAPLIFVLSICLGYAYERSGSLWVPIIMHALFNTSSTIVFLNFM